jgi:hypothetical protein
MSFLRSIICFGMALSVLAGCEGTQTGHTLFGAPSNNNIASIQLVFTQKPSRSTTSQQVLPLQVNAYDKWGNVITVPYNENITLSSNGVCEIGFAFYTTGTESPPPYDTSLSYNAPQVIGVGFDPNCGPDPVTITASAAGVTSATISF